MSESLPEPGPPFDPSWAIRDDFDATVVLLLWCLRKSFFPMFWLGVSFATVFFAVVNNDPEAATEGVDSLSSPGDLFGALLSPMALVAVAFAIRIGVGFFALAAAYPLSAAAARHDYAGVGRLGQFTRTWFDRLHLSRGYRSLRWTWKVRAEAARRLGRRGAILSTCSVILRWAGIALFVLFLVTLVVVSNVAAS